VDRLAIQYGIPAQVVATAVWQARAESALLGDHARAIARVDEALRRYPLESLAPADRPYLGLARLYAGTGRLDQAEATLDAYEAHGDGAVANPQALAIARGEILLHRGEPETALEYLHSGTRTGACTICGLPELGAAYDMLGQADSARAVYQRFLDQPALTRLFVEPLYRAPVLVRLAELLEEDGRHDEARQRYAEFLRLWEDADPELQAQVETVRRRMAAMEP
jgi:tetratricopeptide (TPR) repeat protein